MEKIFLSQKQERKDSTAIKDPLIVVQNVDGNTSAGTTPFKSDGVFNLEGEMNALKIGTPTPNTEKHKKVHFKINDPSDFKKGLSPKSATKNPKLKKMLARKKYDTAKEKMKKSNSAQVGSSSMSKFDLTKVDSIDEKFDF